MLARVYIDAITNAVEDENAEVLQSVGQRLMEAEQVMGILRNKGYGTSGMSLLQVVNLIPDAKFWEK